jgi:hypothetical protein
MFVTGFGVPAGAKIKVGVVAAEVMSKDDATNGKQETEQKAA